MDDDTLERQVARQQRDLEDLTRQVKHETEMRGFLQDRLDRLERSLHGKLGRAEAVAIAWVAIPIVFVVVTLIAVGLVLSKPHP
jgi:hypothetical protein